MDKIAKRGENAVAATFGALRYPSAIDVVAKEIVRLSQEEFNYDQAARMVRLVVDAIEKAL